MTIAPAPTQSRHQPRTVEPLPIRSTIRAGRAPRELVVLADAMEVGWQEFF